MLRKCVCVNEYVNALIVIVYYSSSELSGVRKPIWLPHQLCGGYILMCLHFGLGGQALLHDYFFEAPLVEFHKAKDLGAYIRFWGGVEIILLMAEYRC